MKFEKVVGSIFVVSALFVFMFNFSLTGAVIGAQPSGSVSLIAMGFLVIGLALFISEAEIEKNRKFRMLKGIKNSY